ncbi:MAG: VCBS repeat-containing protein [Myxococcales bacterium]|nr:VCBS repeat-containing protein [Myxococcales bacterium]
MRTSILASRTVIATLLASLLLSCKSSDETATDMGGSTDQSAVDQNTVETVTLASLNPALGGTAGGTSLTLRGSGFLSGAIVRIGDTIASNIQVSSDGTSITCSTPSRRQKPGLVDVIVVNPSGLSSTLSQSFRYFLSTLSFDTPTTLGGTDAGPRSVAVADMNKDGFPDILALFQTSSTVQVHKNRGTGSFSVTSSRSVGSAPYGMLIADLDGNSNLDVAVASAGTGTVGVLLGDGLGTIANSVSTGAGGSLPLSLAALDANSDGSLDLLVANSGSAATGNLGLLLGNKTAAFAAGTGIATSAATLVALTATDVDGNGKLDLVAAHRINQSGASNLSVLIHRGQTTAPLFTLGTAKTQQVNPNALASGDVNRDGFGDVVVTNDLGATGKLTVHTGAASGLLSDASASYDTDGIPTAVALHDLDGDGFLDAIVTNLTGVSGNLSLFRGRGDGTFSSSQRIDFPSAVRPLGVAVGDLDQDGIVDLVIADQPSTGNGAILVRKGTGQ